MAIVLISSAAMVSKSPQRVPVAPFVGSFLVVILVVFQLGSGFGSTRHFAPVHPLDKNVDNINGNTTSSRASTSLYPYGNLSCPLECTPFSQHYMSAKATAAGNMTSSDPLIHGLTRAEAARHFSNDMRTLEIVQQALESNSFKDRKISLVGDSHTRQLFISLGCLVHSAGYLKDTDLQWKHNRKRRGPGSGFIDILTETETALHSELASGAFYLKGGGQVSYQWSGLLRGIQSQYLNPCRGGKPVFNMTSTDVLVLAGGTHMQKRNMLVNAYAEVFKCIEENQAKGKLTTWPKVGYLITPHTHFMTETGDYNAEKQSEICKSYSPNRALQEQDISALAPYRNSSVSFLLGGSLDQSNLGMLHPWHGDCAHALQPGVPDVYAADLAAFMMQSVETLD